MTYRVGDILEFSNGGKIRIDWITEQWIGYALFHPGRNEPCLSKRTPANFADAVELMRQKLADDQPCGTHRTPTSQFPSAGR